MSWRSVFYLNPSIDFLGNVPKDRTKIFHHAWLLQIYFMQERLALFCMCQDRRHGKTSYCRYHIVQREFMYSRSCFLNLSCFHCHRWKIISLRRNTKVKKFPKNECHFLSHWKESEASVLSAYGWWMPLNYISQQKSQAQQLLLQKT